MGAILRGCNPPVNQIQFQFWSITSCMRSTTTIPHRNSSHIQILQPLFTRLCSNVRSNANHNQVNGRYWSLLLVWLSVRMYVQLFNLGILEMSYRFPTRYIDLLFSQLQGRKQSNSIIQTNKYVRSFYTCSVRFFIF